MDALRTLMTDRPIPCKMIRLYSLVAHLLIFSLLAGLQGVSAQDTTELALFQMVEGTISAGDSQSWTITLSEGQVISLAATATSDDLDPIVTLSTGSGTVLLTNDDYNPPQDKNAALEAITIPRLDTYSVTVSGFGETAGTYELTVNAGFASTVLDTTVELQGNWLVLDNQSVIDVSADQIALVMNQPQQRGLVSLTGVTLPAAFYAQTDILEISSRSGWNVGMALMQRAEAYYLYQVNERGQWRALVHLNGEDRILRDWVTHPAIVAGQTAFRQAVLARNHGFDFFYNDVFIGTVIDNTLNTFGQLGVTVETNDSLDNETIVRYANTRISAPLTDSAEALLPQQLIVGNSTVMVQELQRRGVIPAEGRLGLTIQESSATLNRPGVNEILLGGGQTFGKQVIGTTVSWQIQGDEPAGCGLILRAQNSTDYMLAYLDQTGGYGISQRVQQTFQPGLFGENSLFANSETHHMLVIADDNRFDLYIDGLWAGETTGANRTGSMGNAAINFEPTVTNCQFRDTWLWSWD